MWPFFYKHYRFTRVLSHVLPQSGELGYSHTTFSKMTTKKAETLITSTIETLDNGAEGVKPKDGASLIKDWIAIVKTDETASGIADDVQELHDELGEKDPDIKKLAQLIKKLGEETTRAAKKADDEELQSSLKDLSDSLKDFAKELK